MSKRVKMIQVSNNRWNLVAPKGHLLVEDILIYSAHEAELWVKSYISSFLGWSYEIITRKDKKL